MTPKLYMAPLQGVTNAIYREIYSKFFTGYDRALAPFTKSHKTHGVKKSSLRDILPERNHTSFALIPQILSKSSVEIIALATSMHHLGYPVVNWNLGCPLPKIRRKQRGSGLLPFGDHIVQILEDVIPAIRNQISIKVRLGCEDNHDLLRLLPRLDVFPLTEIVIHPRTGQQMYSGQTDLAIFEECLKITCHKIVYNGDIKTAPDYRQLANRFPTVQRWMIGRGGVINPFLPELIKQPKYLSTGDKFEKFLAFQQAIFEAYRHELSGPGHLLGKIKEIWAYWAKAFSNKDDVLKSVTRARSVAQYQKAIDRIRKRPESFML
ncbi:MAG: tRNA-dihydrouridine synthase family protein [Candidatus Omnitrophica bacterium]|nr:tRNA-dihydrouridine synthase family protein [Candidatus Omnitrophota bacterium]